MEFLIAISYVLCALLGVLVGGVTGYIIRQRITEVSAKDHKALVKQEKLDACVEDLIEFNKSLGAMKGAISNFIAFGGQKYRDELEATQSDLLAAFKIFYRVDAYLLAINMLETHKIMNTYIDLISKLRSDFHFSSEGLSMNDFHASVLKIKACRKTLYSSINGQD
ncbi:MAG: hypothetical protein AB8B95_13960 [Pseudohongiellaceae bacterium]